MRVYDQGMAELPEVLREIISDYRSTHESILDHSVTWKPESWKSVESSETEGLLADLASRYNAGVGTIPIISRRDVVELGTTPIRLFLGSMIWGFGTTGYGPSRTSKMIAAAGSDLESRLRSIISAGQSAPGKAWDAITRDAHVKGLGIAFGTKVAYFASLQSDLESPPTLIADMNTSWGIWDVCNGIRRSVEKRASYLDYVGTCHSWAGSTYRPDEIEFALFEHGKRVIAARRK